MTARILDWLLTAVLMLAVAASVIALAFVIIAPLAGQPLDAGYSVRLEGAPDVQSDAGGAHADIRQGSLIVTGAGLVADLFRAADVLITGALWIAAIWMLRRVCRQVAAQRPFAPATAQGLAYAGMLILLVPAWQAVRALIWQVILFPHAPAETPLIHTFAHVPEGGALRMMPDIDAGLLVAGLVLLVVAQAFRVGAEVQRDSDEIV
mgnify:FL=1